MDPCSWPFESLDCWFLGLVFHLPASFIALQPATIKSLTGSEAATLTIGVQSFVIDTAAGKVTLIEEGGGRGEASCSPRP